MGRSTSLKKMVKRRQKGKRRARNHLNRRRKRENIIIKPLIRRTKGKRETLKRKLRSIRSVQRKKRRLNQEVSPKQKRKQKRLIYLIRPKRLRKIRQRLVKINQMQKQIRRK